MRRAAGQRAADGRNADSLLLVAAGWLDKTSLVALLYAVRSAHYCVFFAPKGLPLLLMQSRARAPLSAREQGKKTR